MPLFAPTNLSPVPLTEDVMRTEGSGITDKELRQLKEHGFCIVKSVVSKSDIAKLITDIKNLISSISKEIDITIPDSYTIDMSISYIWKHNKEAAICVWRAMERVSSLHYLIGNEKLRPLYEQFINNRSYFISRKSMRFDLIDDSENLVPWHQDYPHILDSTNGVVVWGSLFDLGREGGRS